MKNQENWRSIFGPPVLYLEVAVLKADGVPYAALTTCSRNTGFDSVPPSNCRLTADPAGLDSTPPKNCWFAS
jgi:hypothetical protein